VPYNDVKDKQTVIKNEDIIQST